MTASKSAPPSPCEAVGTLIFKDHCYALRSADGAETWLELDRIPTDLVDRVVRVEGALYAETLISVNRIGPFN
jgi:hypothetical protein